MADFTGFFSSSSSVNFFLLFLLLLFLSLLLLIRSMCVIADVCVFILFAISFFCSVPLKVDSLLLLLLFHSLLLLDFDQCLISDTCSSHLSSTIKINVFFSLLHLFQLLLAVCIVSLIHLKEYLRMRNVLRCFSQYLVSDPGYEKCFR